MTDKRIRLGKVFEDPEYEYRCCSLNEKSQENRKMLHSLYYHKKIEKNDLQELGLARWNFYFKFGDTFDFMIQRIKSLEG